MSEVYGQQLVASTLQGLEKVLETELQQLGAVQTEIIKRGVAFRFNQKTLIKVNMASRVALRILAPVFQLEANTPEELYQQAMDLPWEQYQLVDQTFAIHFAINSPLFGHSQFASLKLKDAICDRFRKLKGRRPDVDTRDPDISWHLHIFGNKVTISLDSSGESLHIRGYKRGKHVAPMSEVLAAGLLYLADWDAAHTPLVDGMCGSGTIAIEAALMATRRAPNMHRKYFPFKQWRDHNSKLYQEVREDLVQYSRSQVPDIRGYDISSQFIRSAAENAQHAGVSQYVRFESSAFADTKAPHPKGLLLLNPPYGERMPVDELNALYKSIGDTLKHQYKGWRAGVISSNADAMKAIRLHSSATFKLLNGKLPGDFKLYDMY